MTYPKRNWPEIIKDLETSNLSVAEYSRQHNLPYSSIMNWRKKLGKKTSAIVPVQQKISELGFVSLQTATIPTGSGIKINIGNTVVEIDRDFDQQTLSLVLEVLHAGA